MIAMKQGQGHLFDGNDFLCFLKVKEFIRKTPTVPAALFSAAITAELAKGHPVYDAVKTAKQFITAAIKHELAIGKGHGPTNHWAYQLK